MTTVMEWIYGVRTLVLPTLERRRQTYLCLRFATTGKDWIFFKEYFVQGRRRELRKLDIQYNDVDRNTFYGGVAEAAGYTMRDSDIDLFFENCSVRARR